MKSHNKVGCYHDYDYVSWYAYFDNYGSNARFMVYYDFNGIFLIYKGIDHIVRTCSLSLPWITWS
jgi:hypothetical protein